jgi:LmbE family N-acetylglucosaminyl deacetylase
MRRPTDLTHAPEVRPSHVGHRELVQRLVLSAALSLVVFVPLVPLSADEQAVNVPPAAADQNAPTPDDRYRFAGDAQSVTLARTATGVRFTWPRAAVNEWDTALLAVRSWGAEAAPWVEVVAGSGRIEQHLDPNALGLRWLNLSALSDQLLEGVSVEIRTHAVTLTDGQAPLRLFANRLNLTGSILVLAPHPDDAEIAAFGLYAGRNATIVTVTSGNAGDFNYRAQVSDPAEHYLLKGFLRAVDSVTVPWQGGIPPERCFNLGYFDARLQTMRATPGQAVPEMYGPNTDTLPYRRANVGRLLPVQSRTNTWNHLVEDLVTVLTSVRPSVVVMPHPSLDTHADHQFASVALAEALEKWSGDATFLLYTNHAGGERYPWGPIGTAVTAPPWSSGELFAERMYSHPLDGTLWRRKLFALESMHDLRLSPEEQATASLPGLQRRPDYPRTDADYLRRAPRANELFFVYGRSGAIEAIKTFLARR